MLNETTDATRQTDTTLQPDAEPKPDAMSQDPMRSDELILVDVWDHQIGTATKERVHREGLLHRAFSVVLTRDGADGPEVLVTRRAGGKYHSAGLWTNSCCSHPRPGEEVLDAAYRRVREELGAEAANLREIASFIYRAPFPNGIAEYEFDHVILGECAGGIDPDPSETDGARWLRPLELAEELRTTPGAFAAWAITVFPMALAAIDGREG